jgi:hypothetical protein
VSADEADGALDALRRVLDEARIQRCTLTYLQAADAIRLPPPRRIHRVTRLLEKLMREDAAAGRPIRAALVVSRVRNGLPAPGFFDRAVRLGVIAPEHQAEAAHRDLLARLFGTDDAA